MLLILFIECHKFRLLSTRTQIEKRHRHRLPNSHTCLHIPTAPLGTYYTFTAVALLAQLYNAKLPVEHTQFNNNYSIQKTLFRKKEENLMRAIAFIEIKLQLTKQNIERYTFIHIYRYTYTYVRCKGAVAICSTKRSSHKRKLRVCIISIINSIYKYFVCIYIHQ